MTEDLHARPAVVPPGFFDPPDEDDAPAHASDGDDAPLAVRPGPLVDADPQRLRELLARVADEDEDALAALYEATGSRVYGLALRILRDPAAAEEVTEDAYFQVWRQARRYDPARGRPLAWLLTIVRSRALDHLRRDDPALPHPEPVSLLDAEPEHTDNPQNLLEACRDHDRLHAALAGLDPVPRQLIALVFFRGLTHEEAADHARMPLGTVKSHVRRALLALRAVLAADLDRSYSGS
ncbi:MAG TPA: sigma-70 family RNA polymerase sigma factor [Zoogloea sp.]|uniref:sigma-70 family RNA polymerase sigma factor n=1 Tax=Zoogloea sp. TaxID=49181 RepID=UPI002B6D460B|nr:sigma-70 family RNA polymerase sigma factor [Zoogloea sp.]HMV17931.1 sigma-70 family RNA polymerase sigma factor [Rhodocyclaceae bacterium]HMV63243.1 sigma-70 family RNA polymerase sigma factor [Rhodocyclaceae bacterium]HMW52856.1 sigma-70 family RNA polymerase sigma factor [Rhodocyclaceae bacterium]HMY49731.1 sigma-70 family RNA polymerase sigma factor [Rhodocyclaceae bacterium]HMZ76668.1 sigma-70 family RNA polymerase sigma factor [Rhodocyclaceae bacterium]